jgi:hypothetical protein
MRRQAERKQFLTGVPMSRPAPLEPKLEPKTDKTTVEIVQRKLYELGYTEVGSRRADFRWQLRRHDARGHPDLQE